MIELRKAINTKLKMIHPRVYFAVAPSDAVFPYLVYDIPNIQDDGECLEQVVIDVDGWSLGTDTTALETLMSEVNAGLNKATLTSGTMTAAFYLDTKLTLLDDDPLIRRRKYIYQARMHKRG